MDWKSDFAEDERRKLEAIERKERDARLDAQDSSRAARETQNLQVNRNLMWAAIGSAAVAVLAAGAALWQGYESHAARKDAQTNFETTRKDAASSAAQARQDQLDQFKQQVDGQRQLRDEAARSADAAEESAATATQAFHVGDRAYVSITPSLSRPVAPRQKTAISVLFENGGRTPALKVSMHTCLLWARPPETIEQTHQRFLTGLSTLTGATPSIPPGKHFALNVETPNPLTDEDIAALSAGQMSGYLFSTVTYRDIFGSTHQEEICGRLDTNLRQLDACPKFHKSN